MDNFAHAVTLLFGMEKGSEFISKIEGGLMELEETAYWLELLCDAEMIPGDRLAPLQKEADELTAILITCVKNTKLKRKEG